MNLPSTTAVVSRWSRNSNSNSLSKATLFLGGLLIQGIVGSGHLAENLKSAPNEGTGPQLTVRRREIIVVFPNREDICGLCGDGAWIGRWGSTWTHRLVRVIVGKLEPGQVGRLSCPFSISCLLSPSTLSWPILLFSKNRLLYLHARTVFSSFIHQKNPLLP